MVETKLIHVNLVMMMLLIILEIYHQSWQAIRVCLCALSVYYPNEPYIRVETSKISLTSIMKIKVH